MLKKLSAFALAAAVAVSCAFPLCSSAIYAEDAIMTDGGYGYVVTEYIYEHYTTYKLDEEEIWVLCYDETTEDIVIPDEIDGLKVKRIFIRDTYDYFSDNNVKRRFTLPKTIEKVKIEAKWNNIEYFTVDEENKNYCSVDGVLFTKDMKTLVCYPPMREGSSYTVPEGVEELGEYAFENCATLTSLTLPESLKTIGTGSLRLKALEELTVPASCVSTFSEVIGDCETLNTITFLREITPVSLDHPADLRNFEYAGFTTLFSTASHDITLYAPGESLYSYRAFLERYARSTTFLPLELKPLPDQQTGDINQDGEVNISDAVALQAFILGKENKFANGTDLNRDGSVDVFDMIEMRKLLLG